MNARTVDAATFRELMGRFASGVTIVTTRDAAGRDHGMTVSAFASLSLDPPLVLVCIGHDATIAPHVAAATHFAISVLADSQEALSRQFADPDADRFEGVAFVRAADGAALIDGALAHLSCVIRARHEAGDHTIVVGEVLAGSVRDGNPLLYHRGLYKRLGA